MDDVDPHVRARKVRFWKAMMKVDRDESRICPRCGESLTSIKKTFGAMLYGVPCGCELWLGPLPAWVKEQGKG